MAEAATEPVMTAAEYAESVNQWLQQAYQWQVIALGKKFTVISWLPVNESQILGFPSYLAYQANLQAQANNASNNSKLKNLKKVAFTM